MAPASGAAIPARQRNNVVLPAPFAPSIATIWPPPISSEARSNARALPYDLLTARNSIFIEGTAFESRGAKMVIRPGQRASVRGHFGLVPVSDRIPFQRNQQPIPVLQLC